MVTRSKVDGIRIVGRNTRGVKVMNLNEGDKLVTVAQSVAENGASRRTCGFFCQAREKCPTPSSNTLWRGGHMPSARQETFAIQIA